MPGRRSMRSTRRGGPSPRRSEEHTSELQSQSNLVCRLLLEKKKKKDIQHPTAVLNTPPPRANVHVIAQQHSAVRVTHIVITSYPTSGQSAVVSSVTYQAIDC